MPNECVEQAKETARMLSKMVNVMCNQEAIDAFCDEVMRDHRTLQQSTFRVFLKLCGMWKQQGEKGWYDLRNEATIEGATKIVEATKNIAIPFI
jgi:hypothetical protein